MPVLSTTNKLTHDWLAASPEDAAAGGPGAAPLDDSLTSLHWLQNFSILGADPDPERPGTGAAGPGRPSSHHHLLLLRRLGLPGTGTESPSSPPAGDTAAAGTPLHPGSPGASGSAAAATARFPAVQSAPPVVEVDYRSDPRVKPPYSYASLICMAMQASQQPKVTLSTIYSWITQNFCYYRHAEPSWQNSIRHNLSLNKCFRKVPRQKDEPGKGGFWQIDPQYADMFVNGVFKRRRMSASHYSGAAQRHNKLGQGFHGNQSGCPHPGGGSRKHLGSKDPGRVPRCSESPLLAMDANRGGVLKGDFDLASVFDDVLSGGGSTFEDLDINTALSSLGCEVEVSAHGRPHSAGLGRWCGAGDAGHYPSCSYLDLSAASLPPPPPPPRQQPPPEHDHLLLQGYHPLQLFDEAAALFAESGDCVLQPWEELKEEPQVIPLTLDQGFGLYEGFLTEMQPWERVESYL